MCMNLFVTITYACFALDISRLKLIYYNPIFATKILVYRGDREQYYSFLTPEAYTSVDEWMKYRLECGDKITKESYVMRDI